MPIVQCELCNKDFYTKPRLLKLGWGKFCSKKCQFQSQRTGKFFNCATCGKVIYRTPKQFKHSESNLFFCTKVCFMVWKNQHLLIGEKHARWKNGINAYRNIIRRSGLPAFCTRCGVDDFRILLVHHIDQDRTNNKIKNLMWLCHNCHFLIHHYNEEREKLMVPIA